VQIEVGRVVIPPGSSIGYAIGHPIGSTDIVVFAGDHRPMRTMGEALGEGSVIVADVPDEMIVLRIADPERN
jgi:hypothetical protein